MAMQSYGLKHVPAIDRLFYSPREAETLLGLSHSTIFRLIAAQKLDARKLGAKTLITAAPIQRLIAELQPIG